MPKFIAGGAEAYEKGIRQEYKAAKTRLEACLKECADMHQRQQFQIELRALKEKFEERLRQIQHSMFGIS